MRILHTIPKNTFQAYRCSLQTIQLPHEQGRSIRSEDEKWDESAIPDMRVLALRVLVRVWKEHPILEGLPTWIDRDTLIEMLPTDLPFELIIRKIAHEHYWQRAANDRSSSTWSNKDNEDELATTELLVNHIPFDQILPELRDLRELYINFGMIYMNDGFEWRDFQFSVEDCIKLSRGLSDSCALNKFCLTRSNLDQPRVAALLRGIAINNRIQILDLSHCKLGDTGAHAIGEFLTKHRCLKELHLANNKIGDSGIAGIVYGLLQENSTPLKHLNLRLNPLGDAGGTHICGLLLRNKEIEVLNLSGCEFTGDTGVGIAEIIASGYITSFTLELNISNNDLGRIAGEAFEVGMKTCSVIVDLDVRMCNFSKESEYSISESVVRNREDKKKEKSRVSTTRCNSVYVPLRAKSLQPPPEYETVQNPEEID